MADTKESGNKKVSTEMEDISHQTNTPRDLLERLTSKYEFQEGEEEEDCGEIELNLGLSLGGRFGVDKSSNKLVRCSSIAGPIPIVREEPARPSLPVTPMSLGLMRTCSLPVETEEEWKKRKKMQTLRRMKAKRRMSEKQRLLKVEKQGSGGKAEKESGSGGGGSGCSGFVEERRKIEMNLKGRIEREYYIAAMNKVGSSVAPQIGLPTCGFDAAMNKKKENYCIGDVSSGVQGFMQPSSQAWLKSQLGLENKPIQVSSSCGEASAASIYPLQEETNQDDVSSCKSAEMKTPLSANVVVALERKRRMNSMEDMPYVFTRAPNGRRIDGILYKYGKGEEVTIMCVCHGSFHTPAEFVKHAGCGDVAQPLKHIVINHSSPF